jgi:hypothetical protein
MESFFSDVKINKTIIEALEIDDEGIYNPETIKSKLEDRGIEIDKYTFQKRNNIDEVVVRIVKKIIKYSNLCNYAVIENLEELFETKQIDNIYKTGTELDIFKSFYKDTSGKPKHFFKIVCDKGLLEEGIYHEVEDEKINIFWNKLM